MNCSNKQRDCTLRSTAVIAAVILVATAVLYAGCDGGDGDDVDDVDANLAQQIAELKAEEVAYRTSEFARHRALFHPDSHRQRSAREQLLFLQEHRDQLGDGDSADGEPLDDIELQEWP